MLREATYPPAAVNVLDVSSESMAAFQVFMYGRFWVFTEVSRRSGQNGRIERKGKVYYARFWLDVPGKAKRVYKSVRICPVSGPGALNKFELKRRVKEIVAEFDANSETTCKHAEAVNLGTTFKEQAERWLQTVQARKRNPIKPRTADAWT
jgi:hypothetical protein